MNGTNKQKKKEREKLVISYFLTVLGLSYSCSCGDLTWMLAVELPSPLLPPPRPLQFIAWQSCGVCVRVGHVWRRRRWWQQQQQQQLISWRPVHLWGCWTGPAAPGPCCLLWPRTPAGAAGPAAGWWSARALSAPGTPSDNPGTKEGQTSSDTRPGYAFGTAEVPSRLNGDLHVKHWIVSNKVQGCKEVKCIENGSSTNNDPTTENMLKNR